MIQLLRGGKIILMEQQQNLTKHAGGRPIIMTDETIKKLEEVWAIGGTDKEAIFYADISHQTLYNYQEKHPEFIERKEKLKERPILKARQTLIKDLDNVDSAKWYLERKAKKEFAERKENINLDIPIPIYGARSTHPTDDSDRKAVPDEKENS